MERPEALSGFLTAVHRALDVAPAGPARAAVGRIFNALEAPQPVHAANPQSPTGTLAQQLPNALDTARHASPPIADLARAFARLSPLLQWQPRPGSQLDPSFHANHANTAIVGPTGMEQRSDVIVGAGLMNPNTTYPKHSHPPEELYVVLSDGEWFRDESGWYAPGIGGIVYHPPEVTHAMRSLKTPLLAVWCLYVKA